MTMGATCFGDKFLHISLTAIKSDLQRIFLKPISDTGVKAEYGI